MREVVIIFFIVFLGGFQLNGQLVYQTVSIPMRDGKFLAADVYHPSECTQCPTILIQTPYNKNLFHLGLPLGFGQNLETCPYNFVVVDWRGFYGSLSAAVAQPNRGEDGYDVIDWIKDQSWSDGKIGTWGPSALGQVQYMTMKEQHPNHVCAVPMVAQPQQAYDTYFYGGVLEKARLEQLDALGYGLSPIILANPYYNFTWQYSENTTWYPESILIPTLQIGGWYDHTVTEMLEWYEGVRTTSPAQNVQWLLVGPWVHGGTGAAYIGSAEQGQLVYENAAGKSDEMARNFFDYYLLNQSNNWENTAKITYYELGKDQWAETNNSDLNLLVSEQLFLNSENTLWNSTDIGFTGFVCDPRNPSPTIGGATLHPQLDQGPYDQVALDSRSDVLYFETTELVSDFSISGSVKATIYVESDQVDADIAIRMVDHYPDGRSMLLNDGIRRMRFRDGYAQNDEVFMVPGSIYPVEISMSYINYTWKSGHKIKIYVSGNHSLRWDVNLQNGGEMYMAGDTNVALIKIHHSDEYPSRIDLPGSNLVLSIDNPQENNEITVPNPFDKEILIKDKSILSFELYDALGNKIKEGGCTDQKIPTDNVEPGCYFLYLYTNSGNVIYKLLKQE